MKRFLQLLFCSALLLGCEATDPEPDGGKEPAKEGIEFAAETNLAPVFTAEGGSATVAFTSDYDWSVGASAEWISVSPASGKAGAAELSITLAENTSGAERTGTVTITLSNGTTCEITIKQQARQDSGNEDPEKPACANNEILYTSSDGKVVEPAWDRAFGMNVNIVSNTYENGQGRIVFDSDVTQIAEDAFERRSTLMSITIPNSVKHIAPGAFYNCEGLEKFEGKFASPDNRCLVIDGALAAFAPAGLTEYTIPDGITKIWGSVFNGCRNLTNIIIPNSVTVIGEHAFSQCSKLTTIDIPEGVTVIADWTFESSGLTNITIPDNVTKIGDWAFAQCKELTSITIPDKVTEIGSNVFFMSDYLTSIYCEPETPPAIGEGAFYYTTENIYVPRASTEAYKSAAGWSDYADLIVGYDF